MAPTPEKFNDDELVAPEWLNQEFFTKMLQSSENNKSISIKNIKITPGSAKGDHYASVMFRAVVEYQQAGKKKVKSLLIKTMPDAEGIKKEMLSETKLFQTEIGMYGEVLPKFEKILRAIGDKTILKAACLYHELTPKQIIVFEDIVPLGYKVLTERDMNLEEAKIVYQKLAKWHAISYKMNLENPTYFDKYRYGLMSMTNMTDSMRDSISLFIEVLQTTPSLAKYATYFEAMEAGFMDRVIASFNEYRDNRQPDAFYVLCHGDFHSKNFMFKNNPTTGKLEDIMLLDFQLCYVGPIANDLIYSMYTLMNAEQRAKHKDELLYYYFSNFQKALSEIGYKGKMPKLVQFREQITRQKYFEIFMMALFLPSWIGFHVGEFNMDEMVTSIDYRRKIFTNPIFIEELQVLLPKYLHLGYLEN